MGEINNIIFDQAAFSNTQCKEITQAQYDALSESEKKNGAVYFITDGVNSNVVLNENNSSKAFVTVQHDPASQVYRAQIAHKDAAGNNVSAINMVYKRDPVTNNYYSQHITQYRYDDTLTTDNKWVRAAQYLPTDEDTAWRNIGVLTTGTSNGMYVFRRNEWISLALRNTVPVDVPAKTWTELVPEMPDRYAMQNGVVDFIVGVAPSTGILVPAILRFEYTSSGKNKVSIWCEQALTSGVSSWFGCITYPAMPRY